MSIKTQTKLGLDLFERVGILSTRADLLHIPHDRVLVLDEV